MYNNPAGIHTNVDSMFVIGCHEPRFDRNFMLASTLIDFKPSKRFRHNKNNQTANQFLDEPATALLLKDEYTDMNKSRQ
jgi:hypothetical protein